MNQKSIYQLSFLLLITIMYTACSSPTSDQVKESNLYDSLKVVEAELVGSRTKIQQMKDSLNSAIENFSLATTNAQFQDSMISDHTNKMNSLRAELNNERSKNNRPKALGKRTSVSSDPVFRTVFRDTCLKHICPNCSTPCN